MLCKSKFNRDNFDALYDEYWKELATGVDAKVKNKPLADREKPSTAASFKALKSWLHGNKNDQVEEVAAYSFYESLSAKDFSNIPGDEIEDLMLLIRRLSRRLALQLNRRYRIQSKVGVPDIKRTLRKNITAGGDLINLVFRQPKRNRVRVVLLCDVSKSMDLYASFLLQFMYAFQQVYSRVDTYAFSTSLHNITALMRHTPYQQTLQQLRTVGDSWSGGTRIGECLQDFVTRHSAALSKQTIVIIVSDGWDTGATGPLEDAMKTIKKKSKKVIWLNPLAGYSGYQPYAAGMRTALPYVDVFAPVHNAASLQQLGKWL